MWSKIDDKLHNHRKARKAGLEAMGLWSICLSYCGDQLTDGFVPDWYVATWAVGRKGKQLTDRLVAAGLWEPVEENGEKGWKFHDFDKFNPSRQKVLDQREYEATRKAKARAEAAAEKARLEEEAKQEADLSRRDNQRDTRRESDQVSEDPDPTRPDPTRSSSLFTPVSVDLATKELSQQMPGTAPTREDESDYEPPQVAELRPMDEHDPPQNTCSVQSCSSESGINTSGLCVRHYTTKGGWRHAG